jgi:hypothetical protein
MINTSNLSVEPGQFQTSRQKVERWRPIHSAMVASDSPASTPTLISSRPDTLGAPARRVRSRGIWTPSSCRPGREWIPRSRRSSRPRQPRALGDRLERPDHAGAGAFFRPRRGRGPRTRPRRTTSSLTVEHGHRSSPRRPGSSLRRPPLDRRIEIHLRALALPPSGHGQRQVRRCRDHPSRPSSDYVVGRPGLEPGTLGLKVPCSTR